MKVIDAQNSDLSLTIDLTDLTGETIDTSVFSQFNTTVFTQSSNIEPQYHKSDIEDGILEIDSTVLSSLPDGQIGLKFDYAYADPNYSDGNFNISNIHYLNYFLKNNAEVVQPNIRDYYTKAETRDLLIQLKKEILEEIRE